MIFTQRLQKKVTDHTLRYLRHELALQSVRYETLKNLSPSAASKVFRKANGKSWKFDELVDDLVGK